MQHQTDHDPFNNPESAHPRARELMCEHLFWDCSDDASPFGSDEGFDAYYEWRRWRRENRNASLTDCFDWILQGNLKQYNEAMVTDDQIEFDIANPDTSLLGDSFDMLTLDATIIATGLGQLMDEGRIDPAATPFILVAIKRQRHPTAGPFSELTLDAIERVVTESSSESNDVAEGDQLNSSRQRNPVKNCKVKCSIKLESYCGSGGHPGISCAGRFLFGDITPTPVQAVKAIEIFAYVPSANYDESLESIRQRFEEQTAGFPFAEYNKNASTVSIFYNSQLGTEEELLGRSRIPPTADLFKKACSEIVNAIEFASSHLHAIDGFNWGEIISHAKRKLLSVPKTHDGFRSVLQYLHDQAKKELLP